MIAVALSASAIGELIVSGKSMAIRKILAGSCCIITIIISSFYFASVSSAFIAKQQFNHFIVSKVSIILYVLSIISSMGCIILSEVENDIE